MRGQTGYAPPCAGVNLILEPPQEVAWAKASFHVIDGWATVALKVNGVTTVAEQDISDLHGQDVVIEGRISPEFATSILVGVYPINANISNINVEYSDAEQSPAGGFSLDRIIQWIKDNPILAAGIGIGGYLLVKKR